MIAPDARLAAARLPPRVAGVLERLLALATSEMRGYLNRLLNEFEQQLFLLADHARNPALQSGYMDTLATVRVNRARLLPAFMREIEAELAVIRARGERADGEGDARAIPFRKLALVDDHDLDEDSVLGDMAKRHEARASLPLHLLGQRFGVLAGSAAFDAERMPLAPQSFARALREASKALQIGAEHRLVLFRAFDRLVMANYDQFAKLVNGLLVREGILPSLTYVPLRLRPAGRAPEAPAADAPSGADAPERPRAAWFGEPGAWRDAGIDHGALFEMLQELLAERRQAQGPAPGAGPGAGASREADARSLVSGAPGVPLPAQAPAPQAAAVAGGVAAAPRNDPRDASDLLELLYRQIERQVRPQSKAHALLGKLQAPMLQLAQSDRGFFTEPRHPARQLLNAVAESGALWLPEDEADPQLPEQLQCVVDEVASAGPADPGVFDAANKKLQQHLQQLARKAEVAERRQVEAARGKEKLELAKRRSVEVIDAEIRNQPLSRFVLSLLTQAWADVLTLTLLRHGEDSAEWRKRLEATREVVGIATHAGGHGFNPSLTGHVRDALLQVGYHAEDAQAIARRLTTGIGDDEDDPASRTELALRLKTRIRLGDVKDADRPPQADYGPAEQAAFEHLQSLPPGSWFEIRQPGGGHVRRRLSWYSRVTNHALFVNQRGLRAEERPLDEVVRLLAAGEIRAVEATDGPLVERAWRAAIEHLRHGRSAR